MAIALLVICFIAIFLSLGVSNLSVTGKKELLIISVVYFSILVVIITELLSALHQLTFWSVLISWGIIGILNLFYLYINRESLKNFYNNLKQLIYQNIQKLSRYETVLLSGVLLILILVFAQGILYPPNNWDSMTYHMIRITSWLSHQSVEHFPTHYIPQLYQPPFAEYVVMHVDILSNSDYFSNSVQFFYLLFTITTILLIIENLGLGRQYKIIAIVLVVTIPEVILQASSTQNNILVSFFVLAAFYFSVKAIKECKLINYLLLGSIIGLAVLTKATAYLYLAPILLFLAIRVIIAFFRTINYNYLWFSLIAALIFIALNSGHYSRNYKFVHNILGVDKTESASYSNQQLNLTSLYSGVLKNAGLQLSFMYIKNVSTVADSAIHKLHSWAGLDINGPGTNYHDITYNVPNRINSEDSAPNMIHFVFILFAFIVLLLHLFKNKPPLVNSLLIIAFFQIILFCLYLKWQPWNTRLHIMFFLMWVPLLCYTFSISNLFRKVFKIATPVLFAYTLLVVLHNENRPYSNAMFQSRYQNFFVANQTIYQEYNTINNIILKSNYTNIGLNVNGDTWLYPLFSTYFKKPINPIYIRVTNPSKNLFQDDKNVDCILTTNINYKFIDYYGKRFYNQDTKNKHLFLYR